MKSFLKSSPEKIPLRARAEGLIDSIPELFSHEPNPETDVMRGAHALRRAGTGENFWQYREYNAGDSVSGIDWRRSGRGDALYMRQKERETRQTILFWAANGPDMNFHSRRTLPTKADCAHTLILALALLMDRRGEKISWMGRSANVPGLSALDMLENILSQTDDTRILPDAPENGFGRARAVIAGDFMEPPEKIKDTMDFLAATCERGLMIHVLDPLEITLDCEGRVLFENPQGSVHEKINHAGAIRQAYESRIRDHCAMLEHLCLTHGWAYRLHCSDRDMRETLLSCWQHLNSEGA